ncbi:MAG: hypothetical protein Q9203_002575 [Teloschistes exilis]
MPGAKPKVLLLGEIEHAQARTEFDSLSSFADIITPKSSKPADFLSECRSGAFDGAKAVYRTFQSVEITGRIEGEVLEALAAAGVRFIAHNGAGYDQYVPSSLLPPLRKNPSTALYPSPPLAQYHFT